MILEADDEGRLVAEAEQLRVTIFGYHPKVTGAVVEDSLRALEGSGLIRLYAAGGVRYADFPSWHDHQRINRPTPSKLPPFLDSMRTHAGLTDDSRRKGMEGKGMEGKGVEAPCAPTPELSRIEFQIPESIEHALGRSPILGGVKKLRDPRWWQAQVRANGRRGIDFSAELLKAEAWLTTNPRRAPKHDHARFLHNWLARAEGPHA